MSFTSGHSRTSSMSNNPSSTAPTARGSLTNEHKKYFLYVHNHPEPPLPAWTFGPAFLNFREDALRSFRERFDRFVQLTGHMLAEGQPFNLTWLGWEQSEYDLKEQLERSFPGSEVVREEADWILDDFWPKEFTNCLTAFSVSINENWDQNSKDFSACFGGRQSIPSKFYSVGDGDQRKIMKKDKLPKGSKNPRAWNKSWICCKCKSLNSIERATCETSGKCPYCSHQQCKYCEDA